MITHPSEELSDALKAQSQIKEVLELKKVTFSPILDRILVEPGETATHTQGGLIIPDTAIERPQKGTVIAAGPGKINDPMTLKPGDLILYGKYTGVLIDGKHIGLPGKEYLIMKESDVFAGLEN